MALRSLHIERDPDLQDIEVDDSDDQIYLRRRRTVDERVLTPRLISLDNSLNEFNTSVPSLDEIVIQQRGRPKKPAKISWSPIKSPFKTPTKSTLHMSLLSPSPAKKLFSNNNNNNSTSMVLRNSPRKRIFADSQNEQDPASSSTPYATPTKRLKFAEERPMNAINLEVPLKTLLKGFSKDQLIEIISGISSNDIQLEQSIRDKLPLPDIRPFEEELCELRKNVSKSSPRSRLSIQSKSDGSAYSRASIHLNSFKK